MSAKASLSKQKTMSRVKKSESKGSNASESRLDPTTEALQAFRTITTMLSLIQSSRGTGTAAPGNRPHQDKKLLKLLDAFAAVLVRNNGIVAVTARQSPEVNSGEMEVRVLASYSGNVELLTTSQAPGWPQFITTIRNFFISQNPRDSTMQHGSVVNPETSIHRKLKGIKDPHLLFIAFLTHVW